MNKCPISKIEQALDCDIEENIENNFKNEWKITKLSKYLIDSIFYYISKSPYPVPIALKSNNSLLTFSLLRKFGPDRLFSKLASCFKDDIAIQLRIAHKWILLIKDSGLAHKILYEFDSFIGRGSELYAFKKLIGDIFFVQNNVKKERLRFLMSVNRREHNLNMLRKAYSSAKESINSKIVDYKFVTTYVIYCISKCFVGIENTQDLPKDMFKTFMKSGQQLIQSGIDPLVNTIGTMFNHSFNEVKQDMDLIWDKIVDEKFDDIIKGNNYTWDVIQDEIKIKYPDIKIDISNKKHIEILKNEMKTNKLIKETGPTTIFASINISKGLYFTIEMIKNNKEILVNILNELKPIIKNKDYNLDEIDGLKYLKAFVVESLYHATPIPIFPREILKDFTLKYQDKVFNFTKGNTIFFMYRYIQNCEKENFDPKKWIDYDQEISDSENRNLDKKLQIKKDSDLWAFGQGTRYCPAKNFAIQVLMQFIIEMILDEFDFDLIPNIEYTTKFGGIGPNYS